MNTVATENVVVELVDDEYERGLAEILTSWSDRTSEID
jgi:hypothetical protein